MTILQRFLFFPLSLSLTVMLLGSCSGTENNSNSDTALIKNNPPEETRTDNPLIESNFTETVTIPLSKTPEISPSLTEILPPTITPTLESTLTPLPPPFFDTFVRSLINGNESQVVGVFVEGILALRVVQQPDSNPAYVSSEPETATYFTMVQQYTGNTGLLAHNYLAGLYYFDLLPGQVIVLIYGDGHTEEFVVSDREEYQALSPNSPTSNFVDLESGATLNTTDMFYRVYGGADRTTLQTCIAQGSVDSWGRLFVIALQE